LAVNRWVDDDFTALVAGYNDLEEAKRIGRPQRPRTQVIPPPLLANGRQPPFLYSVFADAANHGCLVSRNIGIVNDLHPQSWQGAAIFDLE
jgi:hypothetical protein